jgi:hypothetical protein
MLNNLLLCLGTCLNLLARPTTFRQFQRFSPQNNSQTSADIIICPLKGQVYALNQHQLTQPASIFTFCFYTGNPSYTLQHAAVYLRHWPASDRPVCCSTGAQ